MKVVIVTKTRMGRGACIGGITFDGQPVRLIAADREGNDHSNLDYNVGDVWDVTCRPAAHITPPHVEDIVVHEKRRLPPIDDVVSFIQHQMPPLEGGPDRLYEDLLQSDASGALYISECTGIPSYSTTFWRPDRPLVRDDDGKRVCYRYQTDDGPQPGSGPTLTFVGFQEPIPEIPAGALACVSLAHWHRPPEQPEREARCYVQLCGWFLPDRAPAERIQTPISGRAAAQAPVSESPADTLERVFGFDHFRPMQADIIKRVLAGKDALAVMPTGSGKSLCYQLPALLFPGLTVVVSPLISLMEDQVAQLQELGIEAVYLNSTLSYEEYLWATGQIRRGQSKLLYVAPETLLRSETLLLLDQVPVNCLAIDEAHCISEWGHDFRPEYRQLVEVRRRLPDAVCLAVTATATERVCEDIKNSLNIGDADTFIASFDRDNLHLAVEPKTDALAQTLSFLAAHSGESGIIYCATRQTVDDLASELAARGWNALPYHAGLDGETRRRHQHRFIRDDVPIIVATVAFGMGIDKSNVRFVLHYDLPKNLESYYQQVGRAGRDGLPADCLLLYSHGDAGTINYFIQQQAPSQQRGAKMRLEAMLGFAQTTVCRRRPLLAYFGETYEAQKCNLCDNCNTDRQDLVDLTIPAQKFLSCVKRTGEIFGVNHTIDVLRGSRSKRVLSRGHDKLSTYDIGRDYSKQEWKYLARQFIDQGLLTQDLQHGSLKLTAEGYAVFKGTQVYGTMPAARQEVKASRDHDPALFELLRARRKQIADAANLPPYIVFSDRSLDEMATYFPQSQTAFARIHGVGQVKLARYADTFLPIIQEYCAERGIEETQQPISAPAPRRKLKKRTSEVVEMYNDGQSIPDIAQAFDVKERTIIGHLWKAVSAGQKLRASSLLAHSHLSPADQQRAQKAFTEVGLEFLRPVYDALNQTVSYDELHLLRLHLAVNQPQPASPDES